MRTGLFFILIFLLTGCEVNTTKTKVATAKLTSEPESSLQKLAPSRAPSSSVNLDSIIPGNKNQRIVYNTSRPKNAIQPNFPHDIELKTADGKVVNSKEILKPNGKPVVLLFWLTTCFPCKMEMQAIQKEFPKWKEKVDFDLYAISTDFEKNYDNFAKMVDEKNWPWPAYNDVNREFRQVMPGGLNGLPQSFVLDKNGNITYHKRKYRPGDELVLYQKIREAAAM